MPVAPPAAGRWRLTADDGVHSTIVTVTHVGSYGATLVTTFGDAAYDEDGGLFHLGTVGIVCLGSHRFTSTYLGVSREGSCEFLGP